MKSFHRPTSYEALGRRFESCHSENLNPSYTIEFPRLSYCQNLEKWDWASFERGFAILLNLMVSSGDKKYFCKRGVVQNVCNLVCVIMFQDKLRRFPFFITEYSYFTTGQTRKCKVAWRYFDGILTAFSAVRFSNKKASLGNSLVWLGF